MSNTPRLIPSDENEHRSPLVLAELLATWLEDDLRDHYLNPIIDAHGDLCAQLIKSRDLWKHMLDAQFNNDAVPKLIREIIAQIDSTLKKAGRA